MVSWAFLRVIFSASASAGSLKTIKIGVFQGISGFLSLWISADLGHPNSGGSRSIPAPVEFPPGLWSSRFELGFTPGKPTEFPAQRSRDGDGSQRESLCPASSEFSCKMQGRFKAVSTPNYFQPGEVSERCKFNFAAHATRSGNQKINI